MSEQEKKSSDGEWIKWGERPTPEGKTIIGFRCASCHEEFFPIREGDRTTLAAGVVTGHSIHAYGTKCTPGSIEALIK